MVAAVAADPMVRGCLEAALCHAACRALGLPLAALFAAGVGAEASYRAGRSGAPPHTSVLGKGGLLGLLACFRHLRLL